jgi:hypothetical protein
LKGARSTDAMSCDPYRKSAHVIAPDPERAQYGESTGTGGGTLTEFPIVGSELLAVSGAISLIVWTFHEQ